MKGNKEKKEKKMILKNAVDYKRNKCWRKKWKGKRYEYRSEDMKEME